MTDSTMLAIQQQRFGDVEVLEPVQLPIPEPGLSEILIRVHASGLNPTDWKNRAGAAFVRDLPLVLGWDVSGVVEAVGLGVTLYKPGDEVFGMLPYPHGVGAHAQYVVGPTRAFVPKPEAGPRTRRSAAPGRTDGLAESGRYGAPSIGPTGADSCGRRWGGAPGGPDC